jgi:hypothetical protein
VLIVGVIVGTAVIIRVTFAKKKQK